MDHESQRNSDVFWNQRKVFVTGATGLVGSWLIKDLLQHGAKVYGLVRDADPQTELYLSGDINRISVISGRIEDYGSLERAIVSNEIDTVFHLAAQPLVGTAYRSPLATFETNIRGTYNLLEACRVHATSVKRVVIASSDKAYGAQPILPYTEDMPLEGKYPYEVSKSCADILAQSYATTYGLPIAVARCGNIYGGGDLNWSRIVPSTVKSFYFGERPIIRSDGLFIRDYIYVKNITRAYMRIAECMENDGVKGQAFNFSPEHPMTVLEMVKKIQLLMECQHLEPVILNTASGEIYSQYLSSVKAERLLDWNPQYTLEEGLAETIQWYQQFLNKIK